jgi:ABC-type multidrug transport system fused ATPase/permease subunit
MLAATLEAGAALAAPWVGGSFADRILGDNEPADYQRLLLLWLLLLLAQYGLSFLSSYLIGSAGAAVTARIRCRLYDHLQSLPLGFHQQGKLGESLSLLSRDANILGQFFTATMPSLAPQLLMLIGAWVLMARIDWVLALSIGIVVPAMILMLKLTLRQLRPLAQALTAAHGEHLAAVEENLRLLALLKAFSREVPESERLRGHNEHILQLERRQLLLAGAIGPIMQATGAVLLIALLWLSAERLSINQLTAGGAVSLLLYGLLLVRPAGALASALGNIQSTRGAAARIQHVLQSPSEPFDSGQISLPAHPGRLSFEDVHFSYDASCPVLSGFNLSIEPGEVVAITGPNGSGKSTLAYLLMRFADPTAGQIRMDNLDIRALALSSLRGAIGLVPQLVSLFNGSVRQNICYGVTDASEADIEQAARVAQAWPFIQDLPQGLDTPVGPDGIQLSGGQRQQIALARALLRRCPILILDEATAMFDSAAELEFVRLAKQSLRQQTVILITHRPASLALADRIVQLSGHSNR